MVDEKSVAKKDAEKTVEQPAGKVEVVEADELYVVKQKPVLSENLKKTLELRKEIDDRRPRFIREEWFRYKRIPMNWRRPDGITSKMRRHFNKRPPVVSIGFAGPKETRGLHPSGFEEVMVFNVADLAKINPKIQAARIGGSVGMKKRLAMHEKADELGIRILNRRA